MKIHLFIAIAFVLILSTPTSAHFFPNISSIPRLLKPNATAWAGFQKLLGCHTGQKVDGIAKIKKYFQHFGYITSSSSSNFNDDFDDILESAVKTYQQNFNLNATGVLDAPTIQHIIRPRCGNADVVNGISTMNYGKPPPAGSPTVAHYSFFPGRPRWPAGKTDLTYAFLPANNLTDNIKSVFSRAFDRWSEVTPLTPSGYPEVGKHLKYVKDRTIDLDTVDPQGGVVTKNLVISIDPYMRGRMRAPEKKSYSPPYELNQPLTNFFVGKVVKSGHDKFQVGQHVYGLGSYEEYSVHSKAQADALHILTEAQLKLGLPFTTWVGAAGMPGQTAYYGLYRIGEPKKGETIFVTGASGAVGQIVGQLAKREGLTVIGSAGSDDKVQWLQKELNFDHAFNYKTADPKAELAKFDALNIYFDNVGGDQLEAALDAAANHARFIECGMISQYNEQDGHGIRNLMNVVGKRLKLQGFIVSDYFRDPTFMGDFYTKVPKWIADGELKVKEDVTKGLDKAPEAIVGIFRGLNFGKAVIQIADD